MTIFENLFLVVIPCRWVVHYFNKWNKPYVSPRCTKPEEELSFENINILILVSTSLMIFSCIMEVLTFFLYSNRVNRWANKDM